MPAANVFHLFRIHFVVSQRSHTTHSPTHALTRTHNHSLCQLFHQALLIAAIRCTMRISFGFAIHFACTSTNPHTCIQDTNDQRVSRQGRAPNETQIPLLFFFDSVCKMCLKRTNERKRKRKKLKKKTIGSVGREQVNVRWLVSCDIYTIEPKLNQLILIVIEMILAWIQRYYRDRYRRIHAESELTQ